MASSVLDEIPVYESPEESINLSPAGKEPQAKRKRYNQWTWEIQDVEDAEAKLIEEGCWAINTSHSVEGGKRHSIIAVWAMNVLLLSSLSHPGMVEHHSSTEMKQNTAIMMSKVVEFQSR